MKYFASSLGANNNNDTTLIEYKLFFEAPNGDNAELYLNISKSEKQIEFKEKDQEYRPLFIKFMRK